MDAPTTNSPDVVMKEEKPSKPEIVGTPEENAERLKKLGNDAFAAQQYPKAIQFYSEALGTIYPWF